MAHNAVRWPLHSALLTKGTFNKIIFEQLKPPYEPVILMCVRIHEHSAAFVFISWGLKHHTSNHEAAVGRSVTFAYRSGCVKWIFVLCCAPFTLWAIISSANSAALPQHTLIIDSLTTALTSEQSTHRAGLLRVDWNEMEFYERPQKLQRWPKAMLMIIRSCGRAGKWS